ncbi:MAG: AraC family transcriptional regulator [Lentisphaeraceae bacterium]|nr:AraC family transcriptional regulator [Lentisphaeraceae bacterium]
MKNIQEKYGRDKNFPVISSLIPVTGWSRTHQPIGDLTPHYFPHYQLIYIIDGYVTFWSKGKLFSVSKGEVILFKPYQILGTLGNTMPLSERCFVQFNIENSPLSSFQEQLKDIEILKIEDMKSLIKKIILEHRDRDEFSQKICEDTLYEILVRLIRAKSDEANSKDGIRKTVDDYIEKHISEKIDTATLANLVGYSSSYFREILQDLVGMSPNKYVLHCRFIKACELLQNTDMSIISIAMELGFSSSQYFSTVFKELTSMTPIDFRKYYQNAMNLETCALENSKVVASRKAEHFIDGKWL